MKIQLQSISKKASARSKMLKMIMPMLSGSNAEELGAAIESKDSDKAKAVMDKISQQLKEKIDTSK